VRSMVAVWVALVASGSGLAFAARRAGPLPGDLALSRSIQQPAPYEFAGFLLAHDSDLVWVLAPMTVLVTLVGRRWSAAVFISLAGFTGMLVGEAIKPLAARPRPPADLVRVQETPESYGFPSSTAFFAVVFLGMVGYLVWLAQPRRPVAIVTLGILLVLLFSSGLSRVYVGAHWATDVLGGWLLGGAWLVLLVAAHRWWSRGTMGSKAGDVTRSRRPARR
jgi:membrane-associated phospholipid phosphatase